MDPFFLMVVSLFAVDPSPTSKINPRDGLRYIWIPPGIEFTVRIPGQRGHRRVIIVNSSAIFGTLLRPSFPK